MDLMTENKVVPKLRFEEFNNSWEKKKLGDVGKVKMCKRIFSNQTTKEGDIPFYKIGTFGKKADAFIDIDLYNEFKHKYSYPKVGEILMSASGTLGRTVVFDGSPSYYQDSNIVWLANNEELITNNFLFYVYQIVRYDSEGGTIQRLYNSIISNTKFYKPSLPEQQKIASFLSTVDEKLQQLNKKKELLEEYKKGVMQKIFSQELRFKDDNGSSYPDWEEKKLGEIGEFKTSSVDKLSKEDEKMVSLVNYMNVYNHQNITNEITKDLMRVSAKEKQLETSDLKKGDILFTPSSETPSDIGHSIVIFEDLHNTLYSYHLMRFRPTINLDILFSHYFCNIPSVLRQITRFATGSTRFTISVGSFSKIIIQLPSLEEQVKIANFLSSLDSKIDLVSTQIENTKAFKKGLLQQMFV
ncbi:restriction endonuclease subunit S [Flavobacteriaceae bacterium]|nr:restriction endonuclease subunit S [Flavobacteriaceae bacterium]